MATGESIPLHCLEGSPAFPAQLRMKLACSSVHEILQARTLEWGVIPFSRGSSFPSCVHKSILYVCISIPALHPKLTRALIPAEGRSSDRKHTPQC